MLHVAGSLVALMRLPGRLSGRPYVVPATQAHEIQSNGVVLYGPGGAAYGTHQSIRSAVVYISTGDATLPFAKTTDDYRHRHSHRKTCLGLQADEKDVYMGGCNGPARSEACPIHGLISTSAILRS